MSEYFQLETKKKGNADCLQSNKQTIIKMFMTTFLIRIMFYLIYVMTETIFYIVACLLYQILDKIQTYFKHASTFFELERSKFSLNAFITAHIIKLSGPIYLKQTSFISEEILCD